MKKVNLLSAIVFAGMTTLGSTAHANKVGIAVENIGSTTAVATGNVTTTGETAGTVLFYIPLKSSTSGVFGVTDVVTQHTNTGLAGVQHDHCNAGGNPTGCGGTLDMYLHYSGFTGTGLGEFTFDFDDLDIIGANDTGHFFETVSIQMFDQNANALNSQLNFTALNDPNPSGDQDFQRIVVNSIINSTDVWAHLSFTSNLTATSGAWYNTRETVYAWADVSVVPLPAALPLYGTGLAVLGFIGWRRKKKAVALSSQGGI